MTDMLATFGLADLWCGVDVAYVQEVITSPEIVPVPRADASVAGLFNLRGQVLAAIDLRARMGYPARTSGDDPSVVYLVEYERSAVGLVVDRPGVVIPAPGHTDAIPDTTDATIAEVLHGCYEHPDGLLLLLNLGRVLASHDGRAA